MTAMYTSSPALVPIRPTDEAPAPTRRTGGVVVIVVTHDSSAVIEDCLRSFEAGFAGAGPPRVVVVDNASSDDTTRRVRHVAPHAEIVALPDNRGYAAAINEGCRRAGPADPVLVLNPDVRLRAGSVAALLEVLRIPGAGIAVPRIVDGDGRLQHSLRREPTVLRAFGEAILGGSRAGRWPALGEMEVRPTAYRRISRADWATGAVMLIHPACRRAVGEWDESFFLYSEETDFALRASEQGFTLRYTPHAVVTHLGGEVGRSPRLWALQTRNRLRLYERRHGGASTAAFRASLVVNEALRSLAGRPTNRAGLSALRSVSPRRPASRPPDGATTTRGWVCFSAQDWWYHNQAHSDFQLMQRVATTRPVLVVNSIGLRMPLPGRSTQPFRRIVRKLSSVSRPVRQPVDGLPDFHVMTPFFVPAYSSEVLRAVNARLVAAQVERVARRLGMDELVCMVTLPTALEAAHALPRVHSIVCNRSDMHSAFTELSGSHVADRERELLEQATSVVYASRALLDADRDIVGGRGHLIDHGVDPNHFRLGAGPEPDDLASIPHPRVGFFGGLDDYLVDFDLLEHVARERPDLQLVLIGDATCSMRRFDRYPNVHLLGHRPYADIPRYGSGFDVALMPWLDNEWIRHSNPIKLKEYLALGLPVVSVDFPEARAWSRWIRIARDQEEFVHLIDETVADGGLGTPLSRRAAVADRTWERAASLLMAAAEHSPPVLPTTGAER